MEELVRAAGGSGRANTGTLRIYRNKLFSDVAALDDEFDAARARGNEGLMIKTRGLRTNPVDVGVSG